jgi:hypothetical protein
MKRKVCDDMHDDASPLDFDQNTEQCSSKKRRLSCLINFHNVKRISHSPLGKKVISETIVMNRPSLY